jgi:hypothetical protein
MKAIVGILCCSVVHGVVAALGVIAGCLGIRARY